LHTAIKGCSSSLQELGKQPVTHHRNTSMYYKMLHRVLDFYRSFVVILTMENGHETSNLECHEFLQIKVTEDSHKRISIHNLQSVGVQGEYGKRNALNEQRITLFFKCKRKWKPSITDRTSVHNRIISAIKKVDFYVDKPFCVSDMIGKINISLNTTIFIRQHSLLV
jgi:hypothetical protein